jgi:molybdopterin synthase sulfur carrier subunit
VRIPTPLRRVTDGAAEVEAQGSSIRELIEDLERRYPGMRERLCDDSGEVRRFVNIFVGDEDIRFLSGIDTPLEDGTQISIIRSATLSAE